MSSRIPDLIRGAALLALAPTACGNVGELDPAAVRSPIDATTNDTGTSDADDADDADDAGDVDDSSGRGRVFIPDAHPNCRITIVSQTAANWCCPVQSYELLDDPDACAVDLTTTNGAQDSNLCYQLCVPTQPYCWYWEHYLRCGATCCGRRLHVGARADAASTCVSLAMTAGEFLADAARLEAASIDAFEIIAKELEAFGAPAELVARAREAAREERRHARIVAELAKRRGSSPRAPSAITPRSRDLRAFAIENAIEGCVRETYGAALATFQASRAHARDVGDAMRAIARDESSHAALSFAMDAWLATRLGDDDRRDVEAARAKAIDALASHVEGAPRRAFDAELGIPAPHEARTMLDALRRSVWEPPAIRCPS